MSAITCFFLNISFLYFFIHRNSNMFKQLVKSCESFPETSPSDIGLKSPPVSTFTTLILIRNVFFLFQAFYWPSNYIYCHLIQICFLYTCITLDNQPMWLVVSWKKIWSRNSIPVVYISELSLVFQSLFSNLIHILELNWPKTE